jgi:hypothetical protein
MLRLQELRKVRLSGAKRGSVVQSDMRPRVRLLAFLRLEGWPARGAMSMACSAVARLRTEVLVVGRSRGNGKTYCAYRIDDTYVT